MDTPQTIAEEMLAQAERDGCATDWRLRDWADRLAKVQPEGWVLVPREVAASEMVMQFKNAEELVVWLESLHETMDDGTATTINNRKWKPAQVAAKAIRDSLSEPATPVAFADPVHLEAYIRGEGGPKLVAGPENEWRTVPLYAAPKPGECNG